MNYDYLKNVELTNIAKLKINKTIAFEKETKCSRKKKVAFII